MKCALQSLNTSTSWLRRWEKLSIHSVWNNFRTTQPSVLRGRQIECNDSCIWL